MKESNHINCCPVNNLDAVNTGHMSKNLKSQHFNKIWNLLGVW